VLKCANQANQPAILITVKLENNLEITKYM